MQMNILLTLFNFQFITLHFSWIGLIRFDSIYSSCTWLLLLIVSYALTCAIRHDNNKINHTETKNALQNVQ